MLLNSSMRPVPVSKPGLRVSNAGVSSPVSDVLEGRADVALVSDRKRLIAGAASRDLFEEPLAVVMRSDHPLAAKGSIAPLDLRGETVWYSLAAPVARHYLTIQDLLVERGADALFCELPFNGQPDTLELTFERGVYVDGAGVVRHSLPLIALESEYVIRPLASDARLQNRVIYREHDENPAVQVFVDELVATVAQVDMSLYWRG